MRLFYYWQKTALESVRDWKIMLMVLLLAPFFIVIMKGYFAAANPAFRMAVVNEDEGGAEELSAGLINAWREAANPDGTPVFDVVVVADARSAEAKIRGKEADLAVRVPPSFSSDLRAFGETARAPRIVTNIDSSNVRAYTAAALSDYIAFTFAYAVTDAEAPLAVEVQSSGNASNLSEYDQFVPALLVLAIIMVMFTAAAALIRENEQRTIMRLALSKLSGVQMMLGVAIEQLFVGTAALVAAVGAAYLCGYRPAGSVWILMPIGAIAVLGVTAVGVMCAAYLKNMFGLLTVGVFPFFMMMFFSGCMFPLPEIPLFHVWGNVFNLNDFLPTSLAVRAFNRVLNQGASLGDLGFELSALTAVTFAYLTIAALWYTKTSDLN